MYDIPRPLTLDEIILQGGIEGSEEAYEDVNGFDYSGQDNAFLYYGGDELDGGKPFTGLYYERYPTGQLEMYAFYQDGMPKDFCFAFYKNGKVKSYSYFSEDKLNNYCYLFDEEGKMIRADIWENGKLTQKRFE